MTGRPVAITLGLLIGLFWIVRVTVPTAQGGFYGGDFRQYFYLSYEAVYGRLAEGVLPLWNPYQLCGTTWLGTVQTGVAYPPHALYLVLPIRMAMVISAIVTDDERVVEVEAQLAAPGLVVLADAYYPGWEAAVDGAAAPIVATNHLFRGVHVPAGRHRIRFRYAPATLPIGALASLGALTAIVILIRRDRQGRRDRLVPGGLPTNVGEARSLTSR